MKIRTGFVSNSSSASFVVHLDELSPKQVRMLVGLDGHPIGEYGDVWDISKGSNYVRGYTTMDNGGEVSGLYRWMVEHGFDMTNVSWQGE